MSKNKKRITLAVVILLLLVAAAVLFFSIRSGTVARDMSVEEAEKLLNETFDGMAKTDPLKVLAEKNHIKVNSLDWGSEKDIIADCTVTTVDAYGTIAPLYSEFLSAEAKKLGGAMFKSALNFKMEFEDRLTELVASAPEKTENIKIYIYDTQDQGLVVYSEDKAVDTLYGGLITMAAEVDKMTHYTVNENGVEKSVEIETNNVNKGFIQCIAPRYSVDKPDTATAIVRFYNDLKKDFVKNFIEHDRWLTILKGLAVTVELTVCALLIGIVLGFIIAFVRCTYDKMSKHGILLSIFNKIAKIYLTVIRGTPVVVQIMIIYFVIFMPLGVNKFLAAVICFGLNSGAYVAEIVRGGIMSVDDGQTEAGRSLGFGYMATMYHIVFPQAFKAVLPALANEFVVLLKETSIAFYIGLGDLMYAGNAIRAATYSAFMPLIAVAIIYLIMVLGLSKLVSLLEKKLRNNER